MQTILLIDSCPLTRECLSTILRAKGYRVQSAPQIAQGRAMIAKKVPDLIITEIRLPDDNALNLMRVLKADPKTAKIRVCLLTNAAAKKPITQAIELGVSLVMLKSKFTIAGFIEQVGSISTQESPAMKKSVNPVDDAPEVFYLLPEPATDPALALKAIKPIITRSALAERIESLGELTTLNEPIAKVLQAIESPETSIESVADLLKLDQTLAMKIMRIANSSTYAGVGGTTSLKDAVIRIGLEHLRELIVGIGTADRLKDEGSNDAQTLDDQLDHQFNHQLFWEHALGVAVCASKIARLCSGVNQELVFTSAILHDIGRLILYQSLPDLYPQVLEQSHTLGTPLELTEKRMLLSDHTIIAKTMLGSWNLPTTLVDAIVHHHCPPNKLGSVCPKNTTLATIIELSDRIIHAMGIGCSGNRTIESTQELFALLDKPDLTLNTITDGLVDEINAMRSLIFDPDKGDRCASHPGAPALDHPFHPIYITMNPEHDAIGHWINAHHDHSQENAEPNIAIIHAHQAKDRQALAEKLIEAQSALNQAVGSSVRSLPVLILSSTGKVGLPDEILTRHPSMHLMTPFSVLHFEQRVNHLLNGLVRPQENWTQRKAA